MTEEENIKQQMEAARPDFENMPDFLQEKHWFEIDVSEDFLDFTDPYKPPRYTLERKGVPFANIGELHVISGKPGHGKTNLMSQLMATLLCGQFGNTTYRLSEERPEPIILYIDTEMGKDDTIAIKNRVCSLAGIDYTKPCKQFFILRLRDTEAAADRWRKILKAIWMVKPTDIFLDGMLDIVEDYNDQKECQPIIRQAMMTATHYDTSMWLVLHENPLVDKLVGSLGSITQRKVAEIFSVRKVNQEQLKPQDRLPSLPKIYFDVVQLKARGRDVDSWKFHMTTENGWGVPHEIYEAGEINPETEKLKREYETADTYFRGFDWPQRGATYTSVEEYLRSKSITSGRQIKKLFDTAREAGIIYKSESGKYFYRGLNANEYNDEVREIPFDGQSNEECPF